jgi:hypothetical protein
MYIKIQHIEHIKGFKTVGEKLYLCDSKNRLYAEGISIDNVDGTSLVYRDNLLFCLSSNEEKIFVIDDEEYWGINSSGWLNTIQNNSIMLYKYNSNNKSFKILLYNLQERKIYKEILKELNLWNLIRYNEFIYFFDSSKTLLKCLSLESSEYTWEINLSEYGEIYNIVGIDQNKLWALTHRAGMERKENRLLAINIKNGEVLFVLPTEYPISDVSLKLLELKQTILSIYSKWSTARADSLFVEIDAITNSVLRSGKIDSIFNENLKIASWQSLGNKIFFTANKDSLNATHVGVLDYDTLDLLWVSEVPDRKSGLKDLQVTEDKIYILEMSGTLHIYEKENAFK